MDRTNSQQSVKTAEGMTEVIESLPSKCKALISNPTTVKNKKVSKDRNLNGTNKKV
jgi:hypothetical protein